MHKESREFGVDCASSFLDALSQDDVPICAECAIKAFILYTLSVAFADGTDEQLDEFFEGLIAATKEGIEIERKKAGSEKPASSSDKRKLI